MGQRNDSSVAKGLLGLFVLALAIYLASVMYITINLVGFIIFAIAFFFLFLLGFLLLS